MDLLIASCRFYTHKGLVRQRKSGGEVAAMIMATPDQWPRAEWAGQGHLNTSEGSFIVAFADHGRVAPRDADYLHGDIHIANVKGSHLEFNISA